MRISKALFNKYADGALTYFDVGHGESLSILWGYRFDTDILYTAKGQGWDRIHANEFSDLGKSNEERFDSWGRYDPRSEGLSWVFPNNKGMPDLEYRAKAKIIKEKLKSKFGEDVIFRYYQPDELEQIAYKKVISYGGDGNGKMIAIFPNKDSVKKLKEFVDSLDLSGAKEILKPDEYHTTIRYWKGEEELTDQVIEMLEDNIKVTEEISLKPQGFELFGDENCLVIELEADKDIKSLFGYVDDKLQSIGIPPSDYDTFRPHITLAVGVEKKPDIDLDMTIIYDRIALVQNDKSLWSSSK